LIKRAISRDDFFLGAVAVEISADVITLVTVGHDGVIIAAVHSKI
jgi:hypothetical protein